MDPEFLKYLASLGVGGILAGVIFYFHTKITDAHRSDLKGIIAAQQSREDALLRKLDENTVSNTRLIAVIDALQALVARELNAGDRGEHRR
jgi:uncharacterized membrane protein